MGDYHLNLRKKGSNEIMIRQKDTPKSLFMPSVDEMMKSVSSVFLSDTVGVLMTGMGRDGAEGMGTILKNGGVTIAESEETAIVFGMPKEAIKSGAATYVLPNWQISEKIIDEVGEVKNE
jgi:two-component system chemotaxis response regulator CheB